ncbi:hypothetical protein Taro_051210, partial [Colocasia esculenta]|nr:hypothetical protein [Colocasia esculenta]
LRVSAPLLTLIFQKPSLFKSMAAPVVFGSVGGYGAEFLTTEQQERFTFVKTKLCGNKTVDIANLEKNGMHNIVAAMERMKWMEIATFSEVSYPDLVKAFYVCLRTEADGSLTSSVKGPEFRLKDGKLDINQMNAFNHLLHFVVCQILVPRSATFSTCTKADSDMMFWAIQNKEINLAEVILERMKFAHDQIWDTKSKLNVSLPYAHLLSKLFKHFGINLSGAVVEKMGQAIRSRNLRKSGFSVVNGVWTKTSVAEGEAIIGKAQEVQEEVGEAAVQLNQEESVAVAAEVQEENPEAPAAAVPDAPIDPESARGESQVVQEKSAEQVVALAEEQEADFIQEIVEEISLSDRRIEDIPLEHLVPVEEFQEIAPPSSRIGSVLRRALESIPSTQYVEKVASKKQEAVASGHTDEIVIEEAPSQGEQEVTHDDIVVDGAPIQGEQEVDEQTTPQGEGTGSVPLINEEHDNFVEPSERPVNEIGALSTEVHNLRDDFRMFKQLCKWMKSEFDSVKKLISSREQSSSAPPVPSPAAPVSSSGPSEAKQQESLLEQSLLEETYTCEYKASKCPYP